MFDLGHILYMVISAGLSAAILYFMFKHFKSDEQKTAGLKFFAIITVIIHYSSLWVDYLTQGGTAEISSVMLFPIHPCNVCMWLLVASAFIKNKKGELYRILAEFTFWGGTVCGFIGILLNENYDSTPNLLDYDVLKGLLSHSTMLIGCIYLLVSGIVRIRVKNVFSVVAGLLFFVVDGTVINVIYAIFKLDPCNSMYLLEPPFSDIPWLITPVMGLMGVAVAFICTAIYEQIALPKAERWYTLLRKKSEEKKRAAV